jgi:hypothetical protein
VAAFFGLFRYFLNMSHSQVISDPNRDLFDRLGIEYLESNRYRPEFLGRRNVKWTRYYRWNTREFDELALRYGTALRSGNDLPRLEIRLIGGPLGYGLFTLDSLAPGDLIEEYVGEVSRARHGKPLPNGGYTTEYSWGYPKVWNLGRELEIDARLAGGPLRFANHAPEEPARSETTSTAEPEHFPFEGRWRVVFVARTAIKAGDEITVDYGEAYWSGSERDLVGESPDATKNDDPIS